MKSIETFVQVEVLRPNVSHSGIQEGARRERGRVIISPPLLPLSLEEGAWKERGRVAMQFETK